MRSNIEVWRALQDEDYFENHPCYRGLTDSPDNFDPYWIGLFRPLASDMIVVVIGCGYGRDTALIAPRVAHVYGIDVSERILGKTERFLRDRNVTNFTPVLAEKYKTAIPSGIDLVYSMVVMQHLTRDLVRDYLISLGTKLSPSGNMLIQFLQEKTGDLNEDASVDLKVEPKISWSPFQIADAVKEAGLKLHYVRTLPVDDNDTFWHWTFIGRP